MASSIQVKILLQTHQTRLTTQIQIKITQIQTQIKVTQIQTTQTQIMPMQIKTQAHTIIQTQIYQKQV